VTTARQTNRYQRKGKDDKTARQEFELSDDTPETNSMPRENSLVSVIMPVFNGEDFLRDALESVINQDYKNIEIIIVNDGSTDSSQKIIEIFALEVKNQFIIRTLKHSSRKGVSAAKNTGIKVANGSYLAIVASDDLQKKNRISLPLTILQNNPAIGIVFLDCEMIDERGLLLNRSKGYPESMNGNNAMLFQLRRNHLFSGHFLARMEVCPEFNESIESGVDYEWAWQVLINNTQIHILAESIAYYRIHKNNLSANAKKSGESVKQIMQSLDFNKIESLLKGKFPAEEIDIPLAWASLAAVRPKQALNYLQRISRVSKKMKKEHLFALGVTWFQLKNYECAEKAFRSLVGLKNSDAAALNNLAVMLSTQGKKKRMIHNLLSRSIQLHPEYRDAADNLRKIANNHLQDLRITERPLRDTVIHDEHYQL
jgi:glycosyltransferase involved in cell wall biosynthesis